MPDILENTEDLLGEPPFYQPDEEIEVDTVAAPQIKRGRGRPRKYPRPEDLAADGENPLEVKVVHDEKPSQIMQQIRDQEDLELAEYLGNLTGSYGSIRIRITRLQPKAWKGHHIEGTLDTFDEPVTEEQIKDLYGGGHYDLMIMRPSPKNKDKWVYATRRKLKISGDPVIRGVVQEDRPSDGPKEDPSVARTAIETLSKMATGNRGTDPALQSLIGGLQSQLEVLQKSLAAKDDRLLDLVNKKPENTFTDKLLEKTLAGESARLDAIRTQHYSEISVIRERAQAEVERIHASYKDQVNALVRAHDREIDNINRSNDARVEALKLSHESVTSGFKREITHLDRELSSARNELDRLRAEKTKSPVEMAGELIKLKDALGDAFGGDGGSEQPTSAIERIFSGLAQSPIAQGIAQRLAEGPGAPGAPGQPGAQARPQGPTQADIEREFPINQPRKMPDGRVVVRKATGEIVELRPKKKPKVEIKGGEQITIDPAELKQLIKFMEGAVGTTEPQIFAQSVRTMIPVSLQKVIGANSQGVDHFLDEVANLEPGSPLSYQAGREWVREVAKYIYRPS